MAKGVNKVFLLGNVGKYSVGNLGGADTSNAGSSGANAK